MAGVKPYLLGVFLLLPAMGYGQPVELCGVHWPPYTISDDRTIAEGLSFAIYEEAFTRLGLEVNATRLPWKRCQVEVSRGRYDAIMDADKVLFEDYVFGKNTTNFNPVTIYVRRRSPMNHYDPEVLEGRQVGIVEGYVGYLAIAEQHGWKVVETRSEKHTFRMLAEQRIDFAMVDEASAPLLTPQLEVDFKPLDPPVFIQELSLGFHPSNRDLMERYDRAISEMIQDGTLDELYRQHLPYSYSEIRKRARRQEGNAQQE